MGANSIHLMTKFFLSCDAAHESSTKSRPDVVLYGQNSEDNPHEVSELELVPKQAQRHRVEKLNFDQIALEYIFF